MRESSKIRYTLGRAALAVAVLVGATGCAQIPTESGVSGRPIGEIDSGDVFFKATGPRAGATPQEIVDGYIFAQADLTDNWQVAREFMTAEASAKWNPNHGVSIYSGDVELKVAEALSDSAGEESAGGESESAESKDSEPTGEPAGEGETSGSERPVDPAKIDPDDSSIVSVVISGKAKSSGSVDSVGHFTEALSGANFDQTYELVRDAQGEWRVDSVSEGIIMSVSNFQSVYRAASVYFLTADQKFLVPEVRWVPRVKSETYAVTALLAGPSPWLRDAVHTAIPESTRLMYDSVSTEAGQAVVNLSSEVLSAQATQRALIVSQLEATLTKLPGIRSVLVESNSIVMEKDVDPNLIKDPILATSPLVLVDNTLKQLNGRVADELPGVGSLSKYHPTALALMNDVGQGVFLDGEQLIREIPNAKDETDVLLQGASLVAPSIDRFGWVWSGESRQVGKSEGVLSVVASPDEKIEVSVPWLSGRRVNALRVSHDGARLAVISTDGSSPQIDVAGISRDDKNRPVGVSDPIAVGGQLAGASFLQWVDESTLGVIGHSATSDGLGFYSVPLSGKSELIAPVEQVTSLGIGRGLRSVFVSTEDGRILTRSSSGSTWTELVNNATLPTFPG